MKHKLSITILLLGMYLITQVFGLIVVDSYVSQDLPIGLEISEEEEIPGLWELVISFMIAFFLIFLLMKYQWRFIMKTWFFLVVAIAIAVSISVFTRGFFGLADHVALIIAAVLSYFKIFRPNFTVHNLTELLIYPGIAAIFVQFITPITIIGLLVLISLYDMWAVWKSGIMQQMARFQMEELKVFGGFLLPSTDKKTKLKIKEIRTKYKGKEIPKSIKKKKFKINFAILGGGDVVFPLIAAGIYYVNFGLPSALYIVLGGLIGLGYLFSQTKKDRAYPAMPYISLGILFGMLAWELFPI